MQQNIVIEFKANIDYLVCIQHDVSLSEEEGSKLGRKINFIHFGPMSEACFEHIEH